MTRRDTDRKPALPPSIAFNANTLAAAFQPIYGIRDGHAAGYEALLRATDAQGRPVRVSELFEGLGPEEIVSLDRTARTLHLRSFASIDPGARLLFLNVHPLAAVADRGFASQARARVAYFGLSPARVCLEIPEASAGDEAALVEAVAEFRDLGFRIAMDDFGRGRSNLDRLASLRPDYVKIDRCVLADAVGEANSRNFLAPLVTLLHEAGSQVVMVGVRDAAEALLALEAGVDHLQGHFLAPPDARLPDDALGIRMLAELVRIRGAASAAAPGSGGGVSRLLRTARGLGLAREARAPRKATG